MLTNLEIERVYKFIKAVKNGERPPKITHLILSGRLPPKLFRLLSRKYLKENKTYMYMITFTCGDSVDIKDEEVLKKIENYIIDIFLKPIKRVIRLDFVREGTVLDGLRPHWHFGVVSKCYISGDMWKTYRKKYGSIKSKASVLNNYDDILTYIRKTSNSTKILPKIPLKSEAAL